MSGEALRTATVEVSDADLPLHCPMAKTPLWSAHPRVFLQFGASGEAGVQQAKCPYCGTIYLRRGGHAAAH